MVNELYMGCQSTSLAKRRAALCAAILDTPVYGVDVLLEVFLEIAFIIALGAGVFHPIMDP